MVSVSEALIRSFLPCLGKSFGDPVQQKTVDQGQFFHGPLT